MEQLQNYLPLFGILALLFVFYKNAWVSKQDAGNEKMQTIASNISKGAMAFLKAEYKVLTIFVIAVAVLLAFKGSNETETQTVAAVNATCVNNNEESVQSWDASKDIDGKECEESGNKYSAAVPESTNEEPTSHWMVAISFVVGAIALD